MSDYSRHANYYIKRYPRKKGGALPLYGEKEDTHRYFRCRICGFICDIQRDGLGSGDGVHYDPFYETVINGSILLETGDFILLETGDQLLYEGGTTKYIPVVTDGCRLCGSKNYM